MDDPKFYICRAVFNLGDTIKYYMLGYSDSVTAKMRAIGITGCDEKKMIEVSGDVYQEYYILYKLQKVYKLMLELSYADVCFSYAELDMVIDKLKEQQDKMDIKCPVTKVIVVPYWEFCEATAGLWI